MIKHRYPLFVLTGIAALFINGCTQNISKPSTSSPSMSNTTTPTANHPMSQFPVQVPFDAAKANQTASVDFWVSPPPNYSLADSELRPNWVFYINLSSPYSEQSDAISTIRSLTLQRKPLYQLKIYRIDTDKPELQTLHFATLDEHGGKPTISSLFFPTPISASDKERNYALAYLIVPKTQAGHYRAEITSTIDTPELTPFSFKFSVALGPKR